MLLGLRNGKNKSKNKNENIDKIKILFKIVINRGKIRSQNKSIQYKNDISSILNNDNNINTKKYYANKNDDVSTVHVISINLTFEKSIQHKII